MENKDFHKDIETGKKIFKQLEGLDFAKLAGALMGNTGPKRKVNPIEQMWKKK